MGRKGVMLYVHVRIGLFTSTTSSFILLYPSTVVPRTSQPLCPLFPSFIERFVFFPSSFLVAV
jgi:hypothetical protein